MRPRLSVSLLVLYDRRKRFLLQHRSVDAPVLANHWAFFGGQAHARELPEQALVREAAEELGYAVRAPHLVMVRRFRRGNRAGLIYMFAESFRGAATRLRLGEGQAMGWFRIDETRTLTMIRRDREMLAAVHAYVAQKGMS